MSYINPDVKDLYTTVENKTIKQSTIISAEPPSTKEDVEAVIRKYFIGHKTLENLYKMYKHGASITSNKKNSLNQFNFIVNAWFDTMKIEHPNLEKDLSKIQKSLIPIQKILDNLVRNDNIDNTIFIAALCGLLISMI